MTNTKDYFFKLLVPLFFVFNAVVYIAGFPEMSKIFVAGAIGILGFVFSYNIISSNKKIAIFFIIMMVSAFFSSLFNQNISSGNFIATIFYMGMAFILLEFGVDQKLSTMFFYGLSAYFFLQIASGNPPDHILSFVSRNYISVLMITSVILVYISNEDEKEEIKVLPATITFIISYWALGRGGIISAGILLLGVLYIRFSRLFKKINKIKAILGIFVIGAGVIYAAITVEIQIITKYFTAFSGRGLDTPRFAMYNEYLEAASKSIFDFLLGPRINEIRAIARHDGNSHNSFIQLHAYFGIIFLIVVLILIINSMLFFLKQHHYIFALLFFVLLTRAFTDRLFFSGYAEPLLYYFIFYPLIYSRTSRKYSFEMR